MKVKTLYRNWADIVQWLQTNVGPLQHSHPITFWHGQGWYVRRTGYTSNTDATTWGWEVDIDDDRVALLFIVRFG